MSSIQLGDFGFKREHDWFIENIDSNVHKINFGNHDYYPYLNEPHSLGNYQYSDGIFTVRGAWSIDRDYRREGVDWFADEEMNYTEMMACLNYYEKIKPRIVVSHECPNTPREEFFNIWNQSNTSHILEAMFQIHQPETWIFGHHHSPRNQVINGTRFICLPELGTFIID